MVVAKDDGIRHSQVKVSLATVKRLRSILENPLTKGVDIDAPETTLLRLQIIKNKRFLQSIYFEWYYNLVGCIKHLDKPVLEIGSGAGFLKELFPSVLASDIFFVPHVDLICDAQNLPASSQSLGGIVMTNVLHHLSNPRQFFSEATRCVVNGGVIAMIEPWKTPWSEYVYSKLHYEPFDAKASSWGCEPGKPLSNANNALAWIIFQRDLDQFHEEFPNWRIHNIQPMMPFVYLLSGGVSLKSLAPAWSYPFFRVIEKGLKSCQNRLAMFAMIVLEKRHTTTLIQPRREDERNS